MLLSKLVRERFRTVLVCSLLEFAALIGLPMKPEEITQLMQTMNTPTVVHTTPDERDTGDDGVAGADVGGKWRVTQDRAVLLCTFEQRGGELTGACRPESGPEGAPLAGAVRDRVVEWHFDIALAPDAKKQTVTYTGTLNDAGTAMKGTYAIADLRGEFTAERE